jgi:gamma-glutamyltranspeptidase/glutathione hydrolase
MAMHAMIDSARISRASPPRGGWRGTAVATAFPDATAAAVDMLEAGGNAVDAAVAAAWALAVCEPAASGLGGQATALLHTGGGTYLIDGHSSAPGALDPALLSPQRRRVGHASCTIPSMPATLDAAHARFGVLDRATVLGPAIALAEAGYRLTPLQARQIRWTRVALGGSGMGDPFLRDGASRQAGDIVCQPALAGTLRRLANVGIRDFYEGAISAVIAADMRAHDGLLTEKDLASFVAPVATHGFAFGYRGWSLATSAPPGAGIHLALALKVLERLSDLAHCDEDRWFEAIAFATFTAFHARERAPVAIDRWDVLTEAEDLAEAKVDEAIDAARRALRGDPPLATIATGEDDGDTTHLTVADRAGNVVALTLSIQSLFGAKVGAPELGFFYNNYLRTCPSGPRYAAHPNRLGPGCVPRSNVTPVMVWDAGREPCMRLALGSAGSRRIVSSVLQVLSRVLDRGARLADAVDAPRLHALASRALWIEAPAASSALVDRLRVDFPRIVVKPRHCYAMAAVHAVGIVDGRIEAAADPRRDGSVHVEDAHD